MKIPKNVGFYILLIFLCGVLYFASAEAETIVEIGPSQVSSNMSTGFTLTISERFKDKYDLTFGYISEQEFAICKNDSTRNDCTWRVREQILIGGERVFSDPWGYGIKLGLGPYYFSSENRVAPSKFRVGVHIEWKITKHFGLAARHWSTAGSGEVGCFYQDYETNGGHYICNDWNTGQDSWLRAVWYVN